MMDKKKLTKKEKRELIQKEKRRKYMREYYHKRKYKIKTGKYIKRKKKPKNFFSIRKGIFIINFE
jgi:hypothetical protein